MGRMGDDPRMTTDDWALNCDDSLKGWPGPSPTLSREGGAPMGRDDVFTYFKHRISLY